MRTDKPRLGIPTASNFHHIITAKGKMADSRERKNYVYKLAYERITGEKAPDSFRGNDWTERGQEMEPQAAEAFARLMKVPLLPGTFITDDAGRYGCTPDYLLENRAEAVEIKAPAGWNHIAYMVEGPSYDRSSRTDKYRPQVQGQLLIGGFEVVHFFSWHPRFAPVHIPTRREERFINTLCELLDRFIEEVEATELQVRRLGNVEEILREVVNAERSSI